MRGCTAHNAVGEARTPARPRLCWIVALVLLAWSADGRPAAGQPVTDTAGAADASSLYLSAYVYALGDTTAAALKMLADAGTLGPDGRLRPSRLVFDVTGEVRLKSNLVIDKPVHLVVSRNTTIRQARRSSFGYWYVSRSSGKWHTGTFLFRGGGSGSTLEIYGHINGGGSKNYRPETPLANHAVMAVGAHDLTIAGDWTAEDAVAALWLIDSDRVRIEGRVGVTTRTMWELGKGGSVIGMEGCYDLDASQATFWGVNVSEIVDINSRNRRITLGTVEGEGCDETVDINGSQDIRIAHLRMRNCSKALSVYTNSGGHITQRPVPAPSTLGGIRVQRADIVLDEQFAGEAIHPVFEPGGYPRGSEYRAVSITISGADPARLKAPLAVIASEGGVVELSITSDVVVPTGTLVHLRGSGTDVSIFARAPIGAGSSVLRAEGNGLFFRKLDLAQSGAEIVAQGRTGLNAKEATNSKVLDRSIIEEHFQWPVQGAVTDVSTEPARSEQPPIEPSPETLPASYSIKSPYPNPSGSGFEIEVIVPKPGHVSVELFDALGRSVGVLLDRELPAGTHTAQWLQPLPAGTYFCIVRAGQLVLTRTAVSI